MSDPRAIDPVVVSEAMVHARRVLALEYPDEVYLPLLIVLPVDRQFVLRARAGDAAADSALRESLCSVINTIAWPE